VDGLFALPGQLLEDGPASRVGKSTEDVIGTGRLHAQNHNRTVMVCQERRNTISNCGLARYQLLQLRSRQKDGQIRDELRLTQPEILRFSMSAQSPSHSSSLDQERDMGMRRFFGSERPFPMKKDSASPHRRSPTQTVQGRDDDRHRPWRCLEPFTARSTKQEKRSISTTAPSTSSAMRTAPTHATYSQCNAFTGSTFKARRAGQSAAKKTIPTNNPIAET
jgi:hypothetical protein